MQNSTYQGRIKIWKNNERKSVEKCFISVKIAHTVANGCLSPTQKTPISRWNIYEQDEIFRAILALSELIFIPR